MDYLADIIFIPVHYLSIAKRNLTYMFKFSLNDTTKYKSTNELIITLEQHTYIF